MIQCVVVRKGRRGGAARIVSGRMLRVSALVLLVECYVSPHSYYSRARARAHRFDLEYQIQPENTHIARCTALHCTALRLGAIHGWRGYLFKPTLSIKCITYIVNCTRQSSDEEQKRVCNRAPKLQCQAGWGGTKGQQCRAGWHEMW